MPGMRGFSFALALTLGSAAPAWASDDDLRSVAQMQYHERVLLVFAPSLQDARLGQQRTELARFALGAAERDLSFVQVDETRVIGARDKAERLRSHYRVPANAYRTLLIGKDGNVALTLDRPIAAAKLQQAIDAMPMRQEEIRRAKAGQSKQP